MYSKNPKVSTLLFSLLIMGIFLLVSSAGCSQRNKNTITNTHYITNYTHKKIIYQLEVERSRLSFYIDKPCIDSFLFTISGGKNVETPSFQYGTYFSIYNLSDTTTIILPIDTTAYRENPDNILYNVYYSKENNSPKILDIYVTINDSLLTLFQKDTSILTQFKDYY